MVDEVKARSGLSSDIHTDTSQHHVRRAAVERSEQPTNLDRIHFSNNDMLP